MERRKVSDGRRSSPGIVHVYGDGPCESDFEGEIYVEGGRGLGGSREGLV